MRTYYVIIIYIAFLGALSAGAREVRNPLGRFSKDDSSYDYRRTARSESSVGQEETTEMLSKGGLIIKGFPEGCAYANVDEPLPDHILGYGRIDFVGSSWSFEYMERKRPGSFAFAEVATNLGLIGQNPEQNLSVDLMARTAGDRYVVAQLLDRSELGLSPIVTCISPLFTGTLIPGRQIIFGQDYWAEYDRFRDYKRDSQRRERWKRWRHRWQEDEEYNWRKSWPERRAEKRPERRPERRDDRVRDRHYRQRPRPPVHRPSPQYDKDNVVTKAQALKKTRPKRPDQPSRVESHEGHKDKDEVIPRPLPIKKPRPERDQEVDLPVPAGDKGQKKRIHIQLPDDTKAPKRRIHIHLPEDTKHQIDRLNIPLPDLEKAKFS